MSSSIKIEIEMQVSTNCWLRDVLQLVQRLERKHLITDLRVRGAGPLAAPSAFCVRLNKVPEKKIPVIKALRTVTPLSLADAKHLIETASTSVATGLSHEEAERIAKLLREAGADVDVRW